MKSGLLRTIGILGGMVLLAYFAMHPVAMATPRAASVTVDMKDFKFNPVTITINVGDTIVWPNSDAAGHTATADDGSWDTGDIPAGASSSMTFTKAGTIPYYCRYHGSPGGKGMAGTIIVNEVVQPTAVPPTSVPPTSAPASDTQPATQPPAPTPTPRQLPATGGEETAYGALLAGLCMLLAGVLWTLFRRRAAS